MHRAVGGSRSAVSRAACRGSLATRRCRVVVAASRRSDERRLERAYTARVVNLCCVKCMLTSPLRVLAHVVEVEAVECEAVEREAVEREAVKCEASCDESHICMACDEVRCLTGEVGGS